MVHTIYQITDIVKICRDLCQLHSMGVCSHFR